MTRPSKNGPGQKKSPANQPYTGKQGFFGVLSGQGILTNTGNRATTRS